jgi:hypothetical protein
MKRTDWKYYIDAVEVSPSGTDKTSIRYKHDDGEIFFTQEFNGDIVFTGSDYLIFKDDYDLGDYCKRYEFIIEHKCNHVYEVKYMGYFSLIDGEMDLDKCTFKVKPTIEDKYSCIKKNEEVTVNILDTSIERHVITSDCYSYIEFYGSALQEMDLLAYVDGVFTGPEGTSTRTQANYARECVILPERITPDDTWVAWDGSEAFNAKKVPEFHKKWVRGLSYITIVVNSGDIVINYQEAYYNDTTLSHAGTVIQLTGDVPPVPWFSEVYFKYTFLDTLNFLSAETNYINCVKLTDAINFAKDPCLIGDLQSEFFTNATNPVTGVASKTNNIYIIQKSDAKRPGATEQATKGETTWKDLMLAVQNYFNVKWYLDEDSNLIIEHVSTIAKNAGLDLTISPYAERVANKRKFKWDKNIVFKSEQWNIQEARGEDFKGLPITYSDDCTVKDGKYTSKTFDVQDYITDIGMIQAQADKVSDQGFVIVACDGSNKIINETGILSGRTEINGHLSLSSLHNNYWRYERIFITGNMNGIAETFDSAIKLKQLDKLSIVLCCDVDFNATDTINTALGTANLESAEFNLLDNKLTLDLYA